MGKIKKKISKIKSVTSTKIGIVKKKLITNKKNGIMAKRVNKNTKKLLKPTEKLEEKETKAELLKKLPKRIRGNKENVTLDKKSGKSSKISMKEKESSPESLPDPFVSNVDSDEDAQNSNESDECIEDEAESHKKSLQKLMETDPDFYNFLQENDKKLLDFDVSDDDDEDRETSDHLHKPEAEELTVASDESDFEEDSPEKLIDSKSTKNITLKLIKTWQNNIKTDKSNKTISCLINAFHAAIVRVSPDESTSDEIVQYKVDGSAVFNAVIQLCVLDLGPAVRRFLGVPSPGKQSPNKCKRFPKLKTMLKSYFQDLLQLLQSVSSTNILIVILKHLHYMSAMLTPFLNVTKPLLKKLINLWGTGDETVRVVAFLCVLRITNNQKQVLLDVTLKQMYMTYVRNSKFVSVNTLPMVNFMRRSLVEILALDANVSYHHVFLYIRQLAIHLRNAIIVKRTENIQIVYNWQFVNSLRLWGNLLSVSCNKTQFQPLIYPFVQICLGTLKLLPTTQYFPLRFHITQILIDLSRDTGVFIPVLPFLLEILKTFDFNKKHQKVSMKPMHFTCILRVSKSQQVENGFKDTIIETIYGQTLQYLANQSQSIAFPDLSFAPRQQLKQFTNKCSVVNYTRKIRQLLDKIDQNAQHIEQRRKNVNFTLTDFKLIEAWETTVKNNGTPLSGFYDCWDKAHRVKRGKQATGNVELGEYNLPVVIRKKGSKVEGGRKGEVELFPSDDDSEDEGLKEDSGVVKRKRRKRDKKTVKVAEKEDDFDNGVDTEDIVEDINVLDW